jgi:hypothetical protein
MTTIQSHTRWVPRKLMAVACMAACVLLSSTTSAWARASRSSPVASSSFTTSQAARNATTARAATARTLASLTRALHACERIHPRHCAATQRAVERAAAKLAATRAQPARFRAGATRHHRAAPALTAASDTLSWKAVEPPTPTGESPPASGETPAKESPALAKESLAPAKESPAPAGESPSQGSATFQPGLNSGTNMNEDLQGAVILGAKLVRVGWSIGTSAAAMEPVIAGYASKGIRVQPLAEFYGTMPSPAEAQNLASWAKAYGPGGTFWAGRTDGRLAIRAIEFGNETASGAQYGDNKGEPSYTTLAENYATRLQDAAEAIAATGTSVGLLAQDDDETGDWIRGMYSAVPDLTKYVAGWTIHTYGGEQYNRERLGDLIAQTAEYGASAVPIDITEWGVTTDNGRCLGFNEGLNPCMTYEEAAQTLQSAVAWTTKLLGSRLEDFFIYQVRDQQPTGKTTNWQDYFGALQHELQPKGAYTTQVESLLGS